MPLSPACPLSRARPEANRPTRDRLSFRAARKVGRRVAESAAQSGSGRSAHPTSVRVLMAFSRSRLDGDLPFFPVVQSAALICRFWCVSLPYIKFDTNPMPKRSSTARPETGASGATRVSNRNPRRHFSRRGDRRADQAGDRNAQPSSARGKNESVPDSMSHGTLVRTALPRSLLTFTLRSDLRCGNGSYGLPRRSRCPTVGAHISQWALDAVRL